MERRTTGPKTPDEIRLFLIRQRCACGCGRNADTVRGPIGWRAKALPRDRSRWRALAYACADQKVARSQRGRDLQALRGFA